MGDWAAGALAIGIGVIPLVAGLAVLVRAPGEEPDRSLRVFRSLSAATLVTFGLYTAMKAAYLSTVFATRVEERNLIYIAPLLFVGTAIVLERRRVNLVATGAAAAYALYLVGYALYHAVGAPYEMGVQLYSDALGFAILQQANRYLFWTPAVARAVLLDALAGGGTLLSRSRGLRLRRASSKLRHPARRAPRRLEPDRRDRGRSGHDLDRPLGSEHSPPVFTWVDDLTQLRPTLYLGEGESDQNPEWMLEFWNRSIVRVSSLDGSVLGPGPSDGPNIETGGNARWGARRYDFAVEDTCPRSCRTDPVAVRRPRGSPGGVTSLFGRRPDPRMEAHSADAPEPAASAGDRNLAGRLDGSE